MSMLINQWADQYRDTAGAEFAHQVLTTCQFFDFGEDQGFTVGDEMYQAVRPPSPMSSRNWRHQAAQAASRTWSFSCRSVSTDMS